MRMSHMMLRTQKQVAAGAELPSHQLLLRAGLARQIAAGIYSLTPLAYRAMRRIEAILREEMERIDGQEVLLPITQPAQLWEESGRYGAIDASLARFTDRGDHPMVLAMTHEEVVTDLARSVITSYRQLPQMVFQMQTKFRDEPRPRGGLVRLREFVMKDGYSFHASQADLDAYYERVVEAYEAIFRRAGVPILVVQSDTGMMGGREAHEFMLLADGGEDTLIVCPGCGYAGNQEIAVAALEERPHAAEEALDELYTPGAKTIAALCEAAGCAPRDTLKAVFYAAGDETVLALIRGDLEVSGVKLAHVLGREARSLSTEEATARGLVVGYAGPVGLRLAGPLRIVADVSVTHAGALIAGANRRDYHLRGVTYGRDFQVAHTGDIAAAQAGQPCVVCGAALTARRGIEAGNTFKLGTRYSTAMGATFRDEDGETKPLVMGCYGIGVTRLLACVIEAHHDERGIRWPASVAPYRYHLLTVGADAAIAEAAAEAYRALGGEDTLFDDRDVSAGVKFADADLLGMPVRVTISARTLASDSAELRVRRTGETHTVTLDRLRAAAEALLAEG